jgi:hypothetical protein
MSPLDYAKMILEKVSFDPKLFKKELRKALRQANRQEFSQLMNWCKDKFRNKK